MNSSNNSSFAPLEYYKRITNQLANCKNLKANLNAIPGGNQKKPKSTKLMTDKRIQANFLAKYNQRRELNEIERKSDNGKELNFKVKEKTSEPVKRKNEEEDHSYVNLPSSFFKSYSGPDLSVFKVPDVPPAKKQKLSIDVKPAAAPLPQTNTTNFTLASLFSGNFKPPQFSTPLEMKKAALLITSSNEAESKEIPSNPVNAVSEELVTKPTNVTYTVEKSIKKVVEQPSPKPIISDPNEILKSAKVTQEEELNPINSIQKAKEDCEVMKLKKYLDTVDQAAKKMDELCFSHIPDPLKSLRDKLNNFHNISSQSPRNSLMSILNSVKMLKKTSSSIENIPGLPVPVFYDNDNDNEVDAQSETSDYEIYIRKMLDSTDDQSILNFDANSPSNLKFTPLLTQLQTPTPNQLQTQSPMMIDTPLEFKNFNTSKSRASKKNEMEWLEESFKSSVSMNWDDEMPAYQLSPFEKEESFNNHPIFRSPPKSRKSLHDKFSKVIKQSSAGTENSKQVSEASSVCESEHDSTLWLRNFSIGITSPALSESSDIFDTSFNFF